MRKQLAVAAFFFLNLLAARHLCANAQPLGIALFRALPVFFLRLMGWDDPTARRPDCQPPAPVLVKGQKPMAGPRHAPLLRVSGWKR